MFIENLEEILKKRNMTLNGLSKQATTFKQAATSRWKHGSYPSIDVLKEICEMLNVSADYLLDLAPPEMTDQERKLLENFRSADQRGQESILDIADREASRNKQNENLSTLKIG